MNLTPRQFLVAFRLAIGDPAKQIAADLGCHVNRVYDCVAQVKKKLGIQTSLKDYHAQAGLVKWAWTVCLMLAFVFNAVAQPGPPPVPTLAVAPPNTNTVNINLSWGPVMAWDGTPDTGIAGFEINYGTVSGIYPYSVKVGNVTNTTLPGLARTNWYSAVKSYDASGRKSEFSNEAKWPLPGKTNIWIQFARQFAPTASGPWVTEVSSIVNVTNPVGNRFARELITETPY